MDEKNVYITSNLALCGYLELKGLKYLTKELSKDRKGKVKVDFIFHDPENKGKDLEWEFRQSDFKKYRDYTFFYRKEIADLIGN